MADIPKRTRALDLLGRVVGRSVADTAVEELARLRVAVPRNRLVDAVTGAVDPSVTIADATVPTRDGAARVRVYSPAANDDSASPAPPLVVMIHGGGWVLGTLESYDPLAAHLAAAVGAVVASVEYRLAPEHPAPAAIHDCLDVVQALVDPRGKSTDAGDSAVDGSGAPGAAGATGAQRLLGTRVDASRFALVGDSAGGNLVAVVTQLLRDAGLPAPAGQVLLYPSVDSTCLRRSKIEFARGPIITRRDTDTFFAHYLGTGPDALSPENPLISPLLGDLRDLPPALIQTAGLDPLRDEGFAYARALRAVGVPVEHTDYARSPHGFASWPGASAGAWAHRAELTDFLDRVLAVPSGSSVDGGVEPRAAAHDATLPRREGRTVDAG